MLLDILNILITPHLIGINERVAKEQDFATSVSRQFRKILWLRIYNSAERQREHSLHQSSAAGYGQQQSVQFLSHAWAWRMTEGQLNNPLHAVQHLLNNISKKGHWRLNWKWDMMTSLIGLTTAFFWLVTLCSSQSCWLLSESSSSL